MPLPKKKQSPSFSEGLQDEKMNFWKHGQPLVHLSNFLLCNLLGIYILMILSASHIYSLLYIITLYDLSELKKMKIDNEEE